MNPNTSHREWMVNGKAKWFLVQAIRMKVNTKWFLIQAIGMKVNTKWILIQAIGIKVRLSDS